MTAWWVFLWLVLSSGVAAVPKNCTKRKLLVYRCKVRTFQCFAKISLRRSVPWVQSVIVETKHEHFLCFVPATHVNLHGISASMEGRIKHGGKPGYQLYMDTLLLPLLLLFQSSWQLKSRIWSEGHFLSPNVGSSCTDLCGSLSRNFWTTEQCL